MPDASGISSSIIGNLSEEIDKDLIKMSLEQAMLGAITPYQLAGALGGAFQRGHSVGVIGTYVSPGELADIYLNGGIVNPNYLDYPNYGFNDLPPVRDGLVYSIFIIYNDKFTLPIRNYEIRY